MFLPTTVLAARRDLFNLHKLGLAIDMCDVDTFDVENIKGVIKDAIHQTRQLSQLNQALQSRYAKAREALLK